MHGTKSLKFEVPQFCSGKLRELKFVGYVAVSDSTGAKFVGYVAVSDSTGAKFVGYVAVSDSTGAKFRRFILRHPIPNSV